MLIAILATLLGAASLLLYKKRFEKEAIGGDQVKILVTTNDIPLGSRLNPEDIGTRLIPELYLDRRQIKSDDIERVLGVPLRTQMTADESILWTDLATSSGDSRGLAVRIPASMRAIAITASARSAFGGLLQPGDRVDVVITATKGGEKSRPVTETLEQNVLVLAIGGSLQGANGQDDKSTVTLLASPTQSQNLVFAQNQGQLSLILRNPDDLTEIQKLPESTSASVFKGGDFTQKAPPPIIRRPTRPTRPKSNSSQRPSGPTKLQ